MLEKGKPCFQLESIYLYESDKTLLQSRPVVLKLFEPKAPLPTVLFSSSILARYESLMMREKRHLKTAVILCINKHTVWIRIKTRASGGWMDTFPIQSLSLCVSHAHHSQRRPVHAGHSRCTPLPKLKLYSQSVSLKWVYTNIFSFLMCSVIWFQSHRARLKSQQISSPAWVCRSGRLSAHPEMFLLYSLVSFIPFLSQNMPDS